MSIKRLVLLKFCEHCHRQKHGHPGPSYCDYCRANTLNLTFSREIPDLPDYLAVRFHSPRPPSPARGEQLDLDQVSN